MTKKTVAIVGGGIVGLSTAMQLSQQLSGWKIIVLEKENDIARHQTGHNSGVIHSGIYYKPGSQKALNCIDGYARLLDFCQQHAIEHDICGKVIVASDAREASYLQTIFERGQQNGLQGLKMLNRAQTREIEPHVECHSAIWVPQTGIINYKRVTQKYAELFRQAGGEILLDNKVENIARGNNYFIVRTNHSEIICHLLITCAGLYSDVLTRMTMPHFTGQVIPFRGEYYQLNKEREYLVRNLIYPTPNPNFPFLGVHFTRMIGGGIEAGPNAVLAFRREGYHRQQFSISDLWEFLTFPGFQKIARKYWRDGWAELQRSYSKAAFTKALQKLIPEISEADIEPAGAGVRAQICGRDGSLVDDFLIMQERGVINVVNAPSPAATASLAIGKKITDLALAQIAAA